MLASSVYMQLKKDFETVKLIYTPDSSNENKADVVVGSIRYARKQISKKSIGFEKELLLYCIDTLFEIIEENDHGKICDFAATVQEIPEIFLRTRNFYSFRKDFVSFREKHGEKYFPFYNKVFPRFTRKAPHNAFEFFFHESDDDFKALHPIGYYLLVFLGIVALFTPLILLIVCCEIFNAPDSGWLFLGYVGAFVVGVGLFNLVAAIIHQYLGHALTAICLLGGGFIVSLACCLKFNYKLYTMFDQEMVAMFFVTILFLLFPMVYFFIFRLDVSEWLSDKRIVNNSEAKAMMKGFVNYLWYQKLHDTFGLGRVYTFNKIYSSLVALVGILLPLALFSRGAGIALCICSAGIQLCRGYVSCFEHKIFGKKRREKISAHDIFGTILFVSMHLYMLSECL